MVRDLDVNDPPATTEEPNLFGGRTLTYYGRWTYKYEEAARRGAAGVILLHTDESAGFPWGVVRTSNGSWRFDIARTAGDPTPFLNIRSWVTDATARKIMKLAGQDLDDEVPTQEWNAYVRDTQDSLRVLAEETGGIAVVNQNDFDKALKRIDAETSDYYVLGYYSSNPDPLKRRRKVEIKTTRDSLSVWSRGEYTLRPLPSPDKR